MLGASSETNPCLDGWSLSVKFTSIDLCASVDLLCINQSLVHQSTSCFQLTTISELEFPVPSLNVMAPKTPHDQGQLQRWLEGDGPYDDTRSSSILRLYDVRPNPAKIRFTQDDQPVEEDLPLEGVYLSCEHIWRLIDSKLSWNDLYTS